MVNRRGWSIFIGDKAYKTNFFLKFLTESSTKRFRKYTYFQNTYGIKMIVMCLIMAIAINYIFEMQKISFLNTLMLETLAALSYYLIKKKYDWLITRNLLLFLTVMIVYLLEQSIKFSVLLSMNFLFDWLYGLSWYRHLSKNVILLIVFKLDWADLILCIPITIIYAIFEQLSKRHWVIKDTSK